MGDFVSTATHRDFGPILHYLYVRSKHISIPNNNCTIRAPHQQQIHSTIYMSILAWSAAILTFCEIVRKLDNSSVRDSHMFFLVGLVLKTSETFFKI